MADGCFEKKHESKIGIPGVFRDIVCCFGGSADQDSRLKAG